MNLPSRPSYLAIIGPTASGKSALALTLAQKLGGELVNCDSVQLYRGFVIGAAQASAAEQALVPHHLLGVAASTEPFDARLYAEQARLCMQDIRARGNLPILVGGTGLYLRALWQENWHELPKSEELRSELQALTTEDIHSRLRQLDPDRAAALHPNDRYRLQRALEIALLLGHPLKDLPPAEGRRSEAFVVSIEVPREELQQHIAERTRQMLATGLIEEVKGLLAEGVDPQCKPMQSIGYAETVAYLQGRLPLAELEEAIVIATRQYAKRQETWFRKIAPDWVWTADSQLEDLLSAIRGLASNRASSQTKIN